MPRDYFWEDRVSDEQRRKIDKALKRLRPRSSRNVQLDVYDELTNNGMTPEEADELINVVLEN